MAVDSIHPRIFDSSEYARLLRIGTFFRTVVHTFRLRLRMLLLVFTTVSKSI